MFRNDDRVFFQVHGLPQVLKLKIATDSPLHHLFDHIPTKSYQPPLCVDGPEFIWNDQPLDPNKTPEEYGMQTGDKNVQTIVVNFPLVSPRSALQAQRLNADIGEAQVEQPQNEATPRIGDRVGLINSARLSIEGRSPLPSSRSVPQPQTPIPSVDKIIDDLTQALRSAEDEIEDLQARLDQKTQQCEALQPRRVADLEAEVTRLTEELDVERRQGDSKQEAIQILRNKISALESAAARNSTVAESTSTSTSFAGNNLNNQAAEALTTSLRHHCHSLEEELAAREDEIRHLNGKLEASAREVETANAACEEESKKLREALERLDATKIAMSRRDEKSESSTDELRLRIDRLERENAILQSDNTMLAQRVMATEAHKAEARGLRNQQDIDAAAWNAQKSALEKENKALREKLTEHMVQSQRHEKVLTDRNAALQEKIAFFEDPRSISMREEEYQQREVEMRSRLRDTLAENDRLKTVHKDLKRQVAELETALFECNNVLVRVQKENSDLKKSDRGSSFLPSALSTTPRLPASSRVALTAQSLGSPINSVPLPAALSVAQSKAADTALLHIDPFSLMKGSAVAASATSERGFSSPNIADNLLLSRHVGSSEQLSGERNVSGSSFQDA